MSITPKCAPQLTLSFNDSWPQTDAVETTELLLSFGPFRHHISENVGYNFRLEPSGIKDGVNAFTEKFKL